MDYGFTASMEESLDEVASGERNWIKVLDDFYADFSRAARGRQGRGRGHARQPADRRPTSRARRADGRCRSAPAAPACSWAAPAIRCRPTERCKETINLVHGDEVVHDEADEDEEAESRVLRTRHRCPLCGTAMDSYLVDAQRKLHVCGNNPDCPGYEIETGRFKLKGYEGPLIPCDKCGADMQLKTGRFGKYFGCTASGCGNTRKLLRNGQPAPPKMPTGADAAPALRRRSTTSTCCAMAPRACSWPPAAFRRTARRARRWSRNCCRCATSSIPSTPSCSTAPVRDDAGNPVQIRYSRKMRRQYVMSEVDGKPTGWRAYERDGKWVVSKDD